jgi:heptosyltransferase-3
MRFRLSSSRGPGVGAAFGLDSTRSRHPTHIAPATTSERARAIGARINIGGASNPIELPAHPRILVVVLRRLGDVLLTTPLIRSIRRAWSDSTIEALVFAGTAGILDGNPDLDRVMTMPARPTTAETFAFAARLWKRYALAVSTQSGDRPTLFALAAGRAHVGLVGARFGGAMKRVALRRSVPVVEGVHRVEEMLRLADALGIERVPELVCPASAALAEPAPEQHYAVIHAAPMFRYKRWTCEGWRELAAALQKRGLAIVATSGPDEAEHKYLDELWDGNPSVRRLDGRIGWPELAALLARASVFIGPDTSVTHLAAASGCPTIALYGPTDPRVWGPWPIGGLKDAWVAAGTTQRRGNVWLVQHPLPCQPCQKEGCNRHIESFSRCLDELTPRQVLAAVDEALLEGSELRLKS